MATKESAQTTTSSNNVTKTPKASPITDNEKPTPAVPIVEPVKASSQLVATDLSKTKGDPKDKATFEVMPSSSWPPPIFLRTDEISVEERFYMEHRWHAQWSFFDKKASQSKKSYHRLQWIIGIGAVTVPVLVGIPPGAIEISGQGVSLYLPTVIISLAVAISTALESIYKYGDSWRTYRNAAEEMQQEKSYYDARAGRYGNNPAPFTRFVERIEEIIAQQNGRWIQTQEKQSHEAEQRAQEFVDKYVEKDDDQADQTSP